MKGSTKEKPPTSKQLTDLKKTALSIEKQLQTEYQEAETQLLGQQPTPEVLTSITISDTPEFWEDAITTISKLGEQHHIDLQITTVARYTHILTFDHIQNGQWAGFLQELRTTTQNAQHKPSAARTPLHKIEVLKLQPDERKTTQANREYLWCLNAYAMAASEFTNWVLNPFECTLPTSYPNTRLRKALVWLRTFEEPNLPKARELALKRLKEIWTTHREAVGTWETLKSTWFEEGVDNPLPLPIWDDTPEGRLQEEWDCYCGVVAHLNYRLGFKLLDLKQKS